MLDKGPPYTGQCHVVAFPPISTSLPIGLVSLATGVTLNGSAVETDQHDELTLYPAMPLRQDNASSFS